MLRTGQLQRHVHGLPRQQRRLSCNQTVFLALEAGQRLELLPDLPADLLGPLRRPGAEKRLFRDGMALDEQSVLQPGIASDGIQCSVHIVDFTFGVRQTGGASLQQCGPGRVFQEAVRFADLHAAQTQKRPQKRFPPVRHGHDAELFHFYNGHISPPLSFRQ